MEQLRQFIPLLIPLLILQLILVIAALIDIYRNKKTKGPTWIWVLVILFINTIGPIAYFALGRSEE